MKAEIFGAGHLRALTNANFKDDGAAADTCTFIDGHALLYVHADQVGKISVKVSVEAVGCTETFIRVQEPVAVQVGPGREILVNPED